MVRGILRQRILGAARPAQVFRRFGIARRAVEREAHQVTAVAVQLAAGRSKSVQMFDRLVEIAQPEPRLGNDALQLLAPFGNGPLHQFAAVLDDIAVVALVKFDLQQVVRHHVAVGVAALQSREALLGTAVTAFGIVDIGFVIKRVVGIFALRADAVEIAERLVVIAVGEFDIAHANVVLLLARPAESFVIGLFESFAGAFHIALGAIVGAQREPHVVGIDRSGVTRFESAERGLGVTAAQLDGAGRQIEVDRLRRLAVGGRKRLPRLQELMPGVGPATEVEQRPAAVDKGSRFGGSGLRSGRAQRTHGKGQQ